MGMEMSSKTGKQENIEVEGTRAVQMAYFMVKVQPQMRPHAVADCLH